MWVQIVHQGCPTETMVRFLKARDWNVAKAFKMVSDVTPIYRKLRKLLGGVSLSLGSLGNCAFTDVKMFPVG